MTTHVVMVLRCWKGWKNYRARW